LAGWIPFRGQAEGERLLRVSCLVRSVRFFGHGVWSVGFSIVLPGFFYELRKNGRGPGDCRNSHRRPGVRVSRRFPSVLAWSSPGASLGVSKDRPSIGPGSRCLLLLGFSSAHASVPPRFGSPLPKDESCSVFVVSHHLDGFLHRESRGFVAPRSRSWGSPRCGFVASLAEAPDLTPPSATLHPSKYLHVRSCPPCFHGSPGLLPSCRSPSENGSTPGFPATVRVHAIPTVLQPWNPYNFLGFLLHSFSGLPRSSVPPPCGVGPSQDESREPRLETSLGQVLGASSNPVRLAALGFPFTSRSRVQLFEGCSGVSTFPGPPW